LRGQTGTREVKLNLHVGTVPVRFEDGAGRPTFAEMKQVDPTFGVVHAREAVAQVTGLRLEDFDESLPIQTVSTGLPYMVTPLKSLAVIRNLRLDMNRMAEYLAQTDGRFFYFVTRETVDRDARLHARMLFYNGEDPATGSAAGCTAAWMVAHGVAKPDEQVLIEQGLEMKRASRIFVRASRDHSLDNMLDNMSDRTGSNNRIVNVRVGGNAVEVLRGEVFL
jgi:trans-2,3-dihydro-3-hydroxyanthranilate isomerase